MRSRRWIIGFAVLAAVGAGAVTANAVIGKDSNQRPDYAVVDVKMEAVSAPPAAARRAKVKKPEVIYLRGATSTVDPAAIGTPYVDLRLFSCPNNSRVIDGGVQARNTNVYQQGTYVPLDAEGKPIKSEYHVLLGYDAKTIDAGGAVPFTITSHLICLKGAK